MKRILLSLLIVFFVAGCGNANNTSEEHNQTENGESETDINEKGENAVDVDKKMTRVDVTIPANLLELDDEEEMDLDEIKAEAKKNGIKKVTENEDGSLTYTMSQRTHKELLKEMEQNLQESMDEIIKDEEFPSIKDIQAAKNFTTFTMIVNQEAFENSFDGFAVFPVVFGSMYYQLFDGVDVDNYETVIAFEDEATGDVFDEVVYPDAFEE